MGKPSLRIGIVGCGSGGPATAIFLRRLGHDVAIFERADALLPVGAGFLIQPTGLSVLGELGILPAILSHGSVVRRLVSVNHRGRRILDLPYDELAPGLFGVGLHRAALLHHLVAIAQQEGVQIHLASPIHAIKHHDSRPLLCGPQGEYGPFDLVVVADGARSVLREMASAGTSANPYPWGALWYIGQDPDGTFADQLFQAVHGARTMVGFLPTGTTPDDARSMVSLFWSIELQRIEETRAAGIDALKNRIRAMVPMAGPLLDQISDFDQFTLAQYFDVRMRRWNHGRVVFIGDAAHATSPQLGQGVNMALQDALVLARAVEREPTLDQALARFDTERRPAVSYYQFTSRWLTPLFQSSSTLAGIMRDLIFPGLHTSRLARRQMIATMAGIKRGFARRSLAVPAPLSLPANPQSSRPKGHFRV